MSRVDALVAALAAVPLVMAVIVFAVGLVRLPLAGRAAPAQFAASLALCLEFLLAAGLLRLSALDTYRALAVTAIVVGLRRLISFGVRAGARAARA